MENLLTEEKNQKNNISNSSVWERVGQLADISDLEEYSKDFQEVLPFVIKEIKQINSETRLLYGKPGDNRQWVLCESKKVKLYRIIQKMVNLQAGENPTRIKRKVEAKTVDMYMGILKLKMGMAMLQVFADSYRKMIPLNVNESKLKVDLTYIFNAAVEIDNDLVQVLDSVKTKKLCN